MEWRQIPGFPGYEASDDGQIRPSRPRYSRGRGLVLKPWIVERHQRVAAYVTLYLSSGKTKQLVHRLVALAFHGLPPEGKDDCCHKDHNSLNNVASNLRWDTHAANMAETYSEEAIMARARFEDECGIGPRYLGPERQSEVPF